MALCPPGVGRWMMCEGACLACYLPVCCCFSVLSPPFVSVVQLLQFMLLELEDGSYAVILPLISQQKFRGTLRPPK
jgi:hypothetical protein